MSVGFSSGLTGIARGIEHLILNDFVDAEEDDILEELVTQVYQTDRKKPQLEKNYNDFDGYLLFFLNHPEHDEEVFQFLWSDLKQQLVSKNVGGLGPDYILSQLYFIQEVKTRPFCSPDIDEFIQMIPEYVSLQHIEGWNSIERMYLGHLLENLGLKGLAVPEVKSTEVSPEARAEQQSQLAVYTLLFPGLSLSGSCIDQSMVALFDSPFFLDLVTGKKKSHRYGFVKYGWCMLNKIELEDAPVKPGDSGKTVCIFNYKGRAAEYGIGTYIRELTECLKDVPIKIIVIHLNSEKLEFTIQEDKEVVNWYIPGAFTIGSLYGNRENYLQAVVSLLQLNLNDTGRLVFHLNYMNDYFLANKLKEKFNCKILLAVHYLEWTFLLNGNFTQMDILRNQKDKKLTDPVEINALKQFNEDKKILHYVDHVIALTNHAFEFIQDSYGVPVHKITTINNGLKERETNGTCTDPIDLKEKYHLNKQEKIILYVGRLDKIKGVSYLIKAFREVLTKYDNIRLWIVGDGAYGPLFAEAEGIWSKICFTGKIPREQLFELYQLADVGVVPSLFEPFGLVATEMMMSGLPIIATATSGLDEIVVDGETGFKVPINQNHEVDTTCLAERLLFLLNHPNERSIMGINGQKRFQEKYSSLVMREKILACYENLLTNQFSNKAISECQID